MSGGEMFGMVCITVGGLGGLAGVIAAWGWAKAEQIRAQAKAGKLPAAPGAQDEILAELKTMKQQIAEMQSTGHQFDISFDAALTRLEERVARVETRTAAQPATTEEQTQRLGIR